MRISHVGWNLAGLSLPLLVAVATIPNLLATLGQERFGLLTLAWGLIGYAGALDLGVGRAVTQSVARLRAGSNSDVAQIRVILFTAVRITLLAGGVGAILITASSFVGIEKLLKIEDVAPSEIRLSVVFLALALPMQAISATYRGVNEAYLNFKGISVLRVLLGVANFGVPFLISKYTVQMEWLTLGLVLSRALALYFYKILAISCVGSNVEGEGVLFSKGVARDLFRFGGWFTLSGLLNPMVATADRFFISILVSAAAVSTYVIPYEMVAQSLIFVGAITTVAFPYLSQTIVTDPGKVRDVFLKIMGISLVGMLFVSAVLIFFGGDVLSIWLGKKDVADLYSVVKILAIGLLPYTVGTLCISLLHAHGRTELTAKLNLIEFPLFIFLIYFLVDRYGVVGAAFAWVVRVSLDAGILSLLTWMRK
jgi:O-antigen/teichoic acid export membrane protein